MSIRSTSSASPAADRSAPPGGLGDLLLSAAFIASGPALWCFGAMILSPHPDLGALFAQRQHLNGIEAAETLLGLLASGAGLCISAGAAIAVLALLAQQLASRCGAWRVERVLAQCSPGFMRRSAALALGAGLSLTAVAADSWPRAPESAASQTETAERPALSDPHSALFDTTDPEDDPDPEPSPSPPSGPDDPPSGLFAPEPPALEADRLQGLPQRRESEPEQVVVRLGDSLWDIAADHLGADATDWEIAASWPRWYAANRDRIGADPGIILPGTILSVPSS